MPYVYAVCGILAGLGVFLFAVKLLQDNMERLANKGIRDLFKKTNDNSFVGVGIGLSVTALVQSSGLTTVMVVGFVNAGIMTLYQATAIIMGANIGTTVTAQIAALQAFSFSDIAVAVCGIGIFMVMFAKKEKVRSIGNILGGLGMIFVGLQIMSDSMSIVKESQMVVDLLASISNPLLLLVIGVIFTALVQSSSAITSILISMASAGLVIGGGGNAVLYIILGSNIGSCVTVLLSSIGTNTNARRAGIIHLLFNSMGVLIFMILLLCWKNFMDVTLGAWFSEPGTQIAMFHTVFNVICTLIFLPFIKVFVKVSQLLIKDDQKEVKSVAKYLDKKFLATPQIAIDLAYKELMVMQDMCMSTLGLSVECFVKHDDTPLADIIAQTEEVSQKAHDITDYLVQLSPSKMDRSVERGVSELLKCVTFIARIAEMSENICKYTRRAIKHDLFFSQGVNENVMEMFNKINQMASLNKDIVLNKNYVLLAEIDELETLTDTFRKQLLNDHVDRLQRGVCKPENSSVFISLIANLERCADLIRYVAHSIHD